MAKEPIRRSKSLKEVFDFGYNTEFEMQVARACILFEDLKLERNGITMEGLPSLTNCNDSTYSQRYFVRRSFVTLCEARHLIVRINEDKEFRNEIYSHYKKECQEAWEKAVKFCYSEDYEKIKSIRDILGGHLQVQGALTRAFAGLTEGTTGLFEMVVESGKTRDVICHFVGELTARAFVPEPEKPPEPQLEELMKITRGGMTLLSHALQLLIAQHVVPQFGF